MAQTNGDTHLQMQTWKSLSKILSSSNSDYEYWWQLTGHHLAALLEAARYPIEKQYEALLFHYYWSIPYMGPAPRLDGTPLKWKSLLGLDGSPIEYSWKWNTPTSDPDVRYVTEHIGQFPGTDLDPLNQQALRELLHRVAQNSPSSDMNISWVNHFFAKLYDHDNSKYTQEATAGSHMSTATSVQFGVEFLREAIGFKTYFFPRKLGIVEAVPLTQYESAIEQLDVSGNDYSARAALKEFLATSTEGKRMNPFSLAVDNVAPENSRLKIYFHTLNTTSLLFERS